MDRDGRLATAIQNACANMSWQPNSSVRLPVLITGVVANSQISPKSVVSRFRSSLRDADSKKEHLGQSRELISACLASCKFLGYGLNDYIGRLSPEELLAELEKAGGDYSQLTKRALESNGCGAHFPETFEVLEKYGIVTTEDFFKFANLFTKLECEMAEKGAQLHSLQSVPGDNHDAICKAREDMLNTNLNQTSALYVAFSHMFNKDPKKDIPPVPPPDVPSDEYIKLLRDRFPREFAIGRASQRETANHTSVDRILKEIFSNEKRPDAAILWLEQQGKYTDEFKKELLEVALEYVGKGTIPHHRLPQALQDAIKHNRDTLQAEIDEAGGSRILRRGYLTGIAIGVRGGAINTYARNLAEGNQKISVCNLEDRDFKPEEYVARLEIQFKENTREKDGKHTARHARRQAETPSSPSESQFAR
ncbi:MAG TPA: hypothetical protein VFT64_09925 [Rickettsiales bacterium]|nr:hypothetical protein [Rickettsiales bacterium]